MWHIFLQHSASDYNDYIAIFIHLLLHFMLWYIQKTGELPLSLTLYSSSYKLL